MNKLEVQDNIYYIAFNIIKESLNNKKLDLNFLLLTIKELFNCNNILLFKNKKDKYVICNKDNKNINITKFINDNYKNIQKNKIFNFNNDTFAFIKNKHIKYILALVNLQNDININDLNIIIDTLSLILEKEAQYEKMKKRTNIDKLTGLYNRNAYESKKKILDKSNKKIYYVLFDLFRLKYINDTYNHDLGDKYIIETSKILTNHFKGEDLYRIGGDEFVLISQEDLISIKLHIKQLLKEVKLINLKIDNSAPLLINYGIAYRKNQESIKELYIEADKILQEDKHKTYDKLKIIRKDLLWKKQKYFLLKILPVII